MHVLGAKRIEALRGVAFALEEGESLGLTGKSGSGKSTLMKCIYRTYLSSRGSILYSSPHSGDTDLATADEHAVLALRRAEITYCSQFLSVIPRVPAVEVVAGALIKRGEDAKEAMLQAETMLGRLNLPKDLWDAYPSTFSGGEQQRINIARALISKPRLLLVDEPTASLDQKTKDVVIEMVLEIKQSGASVICITHDQYTLERLSDRILHLENGKVAEEAREPVKA